MANNIVSNCKKWLIWMPRPVTKKRASARWGMRSGSCPVLAQDQARISSYDRGSSSQFHRNKPN